MTRPDAEALSAALGAATNRKWEPFVTGTGHVWLRPAGNDVIRVDCWRWDGVRIATLHLGSPCARGWRDVPHGRGWPARAAAAVVEMLEE